MFHLQQLSSFHIIELDKNNKTYISWTYPTISNQNKNYILSKSLLTTDKIQTLTYLRNKNDWIYSTVTEVFGTDRLNNLKLFALVLITKDFNPEKYATLSRILSKCYCKSGSPVELVRLYLSVYTTGSCSTLENGTFVLKDFNNLNKNCIRIKEFINLYGLEIILLFTAILLKKRIVVYHHSQDILLKWLPTITSLMPHRNPSTYLFPLMGITKDDLNELKNNNYFVAGFTDSIICSKTDLYDLLVNLPASEINVTPYAKESLTMTKIHKDIAIFMVQLAENSNLTDVQVFKEISNKTNELLSYLKSLASDTNMEKVTITVEDIKSKNLHPGIENFLLNLASVENLLVL